MPARTGRTSVKKEKEKFRHEIFTPEAARFISDAQKQFKDEEKD